MLLSGLVAGSGLVVACATSGDGQNGGGGNGGFDGSGSGDDGGSAESANDGMPFGGGDAGDAARDAKSDGGGDAGGKDAGTPDSDASDSGESDSDASDASASDADASVDAGDDGSGDASGDAPADVQPDSDAAVLCPIGHLVIDEVRSRGAGGGSDEFVELFNPTASPMTLDATWTLQARSTTSASFTLRWTGSGKQIPAYGYYLVVGSAYAQQPAADDNLTSGVTDASAIQLQQSGTVVDELCYGFDAKTISTLEGAGYSCPGTPADNSPHDNTSNGNVDQSLLRQHCVDTGDNSADFAKQAPATPMDTASPPNP